MSVDLQALSHTKEQPSPLRLVGHTHTKLCLSVLSAQKCHSTITYYDLDALTPGEPVPNVLGYSFYTDFACAKNAKSLQKLHRRAVEGYSKIHRLLTGSPLSLQQQQKTRNDAGIFQVPAQLHVALGDNSLVETLEPPPNTKADVVINVFNEVRFSHLDGPQTLHFVHCRSSNIKEKDFSDFQSNPPPITINTGVCLFSACVLGFIPTHGVSDSQVDGASASTVPLLPYSTKATMYEMESIARLATTIADVVATARMGPANSQLIRVHLDVPTLQYYCYPLELFKQGLVDKHYVLQWLWLVDRRHDQIEAVFRDAVIHESNRRGSSVQVELISGTQAAAEISRHCVLSENRTPTMKEIFHALERTGPHQALWRKLLSLLDGYEVPRDIRGVSLLGYIFEVLRPFLAQTAIETENPESLPLEPEMEQSHQRPLMIQVDDIAEWRIFDRANKLLKKFKQSRGQQSGVDPLLVGVFPSQRIFTRESDGRSSLFLHDPEDCIVQAAESETTRTRPMQPVDVIGRVYGSEVGRMMGDLLSKHGMCF